MRNCDRIGVVLLASPLGPRMYLFLFNCVYRKVDRCCGYTLLIR